MRIRILSPMITKELKFVVPRALILDCVITLISLPFFGLSAEVPLSLAAGTLVMTVNFIILGLSSERAVERTAVSAQRYMFMSYVIRLAITGCLFALSVKSPYMNVVAAAIPQLYIKAFYTIDAAVKTRKEGKD
ncbi:MAG: ATP synthase subunit I [Oscillospiraceae bacterium]|nr:ATP synthase subunit I [Oscillospiraceae bacterium]